MNSIQVFPVRVKHNKTKNKMEKVPAIPKGQDWHTYKGGADGALNFGIVIPDAVVILDLDTHKGVTCEDVETALGCKLDWEGAEIQTTVSGGKHYAFSLPVGVDIKQGSDVLGVVGFDTRSSGKGWICSGEGYEDLTMTGLPESLFEEVWPELPQQAINLLAEDCISSDDDSDLMNIVSAETHGLTDDEILAYVDKLTSKHAEHSDTWLKIGMAIYHETKGSNFGWELFDKFSLKCSDKYDRDNNFKRWESFGRSQKSNPVTFASIIKLVGKSTVLIEQLQNKELNTLEDITEELEKAANCNMNNLQLDTLLQKISASYKNITGTAPSKVALKKELKRLKTHKQSDEYVDDYIFLTSSGEYMHREGKNTMGPRSFNVMYNRMTPPNNDGEAQTATTYTDNIIECVNDAMYAPCFSDIFNHGGVDFFNTYKSNDIDRVDVGITDIVDRVKNHIAHLLPNEYEQSLVINYLAHNVQHPGVKIQWCVLLQGVQGDGKSFIAEMMQHVLGLNNVRVMNPQTLESNFTGWSVGQCMTFIEELKIDNYRKYEVLNNIKPYITNSVIEVTKKGADPIVAINTTNYFALTNFKDAIPIDDNDRRYCILFSQWQRKDRLLEWMDNNPNYYPSLYECMRDNVGEIYEWLLTHEIPQSFIDMKRAPITNAKNMMVELSKSDAYMIVEDAINEFECEQINSEVVNVTQLLAKINDVFAESEYKNFPKTSALKNVLTDMGYHNIGRYKNNDRKNQLIYCKDDTKRAIDFKNIINDCPF